MDASDIIDSIAHSAPYLIVAAIFYALYLWKCRHASGLWLKARRAKLDGNHREAIKYYKEALCYAGEKPDTEWKILQELASIYHSQGLGVDLTDYETLIRQYKVLRKKGTYKALAEMKKVQRLKGELIASFPA